MRDSIWFHGTMIGGIQNEQGHREIQTNPRRFVAALPRRGGASGKRRRGGGSSRRHRSPLCDPEYRRLDEEQEVRVGGPVRKAQGHRGGLRTARTGGPHCRDSGSHRGATYVKEGGEPGRAGKYDARASATLGFAGLSSAAEYLAAPPPSAHHGRPARRAVLRCLRQRGPAGLLSERLSVALPPPDLYLDSRVSAELEILRLPRVGVAAPCSLRTAYGCVGVDH